MPSASTGKRLVVLKHRLEVIPPNVVASLLKSMGDFRGDAGVGVIRDDGCLELRARQVLGVRAESSRESLTVVADEAGHQDLGRRHDGGENRSFVGVGADEDGHFCCCALVDRIIEGRA